MDVSGDNCDGTIFSDGTSTRELPSDGTDDFREQFYVTADRMLRESGPYLDEQPKITRFAQEVLVPRLTSK